MADDPIAQVADFLARGQRLTAALNQMALAEQADTLRPEDRAALDAINQARDGATIARLILTYYRDHDRSERTPRPLLYLHLGMLSGIIEQLLAERSA
jgi:hypothetical protein